MLMLSGHYKTGKVIWSAPSAAPPVTPASLPRRPHRIPLENRTESYSPFVVTSLVSTLNTHILFSLVLLRRTVQFQLTPRSSSRRAHPNLRARGGGRAAARSGTIFYERMAKGRHPLTVKPQGTPEPITRGRSPFHNRSVEGSPVCQRSRGMSEGHQRICGTSTRSATRDLPLIE